MRGANLARLQAFGGENQGARGRGVVGEAPGAVRRAQAHHLQHRFGQIQRVLQRVAGEYGLLQDRGGFAGLFLRLELFRQGPGEPGRRQGTLAGGAQDRRHLAVAPARAEVGDQIIVGVEQEVPAAGRTVVIHRDALDERAQEVLRLHLPPEARQAISLPVEGEDRRQRAALRNRQSVVKGERPVVVLQRDHRGRRPEAGAALPVVPVLQQDIVECLRMRQAARLQQGGRGAELRGDRFLIEVDRLPEHLHRLRILARLPQGLAEGRQNA